MSCMATRAGHRLGILWWMTHLLTPWHKAFSTMCKAQLRSVLEETTASTTLKTFDSILDNTVYQLAASITIHSSYTGTQWLAGILSTKCIGVSHSDYTNTTSKLPTSMPGRRRQQMQTPPPAGSGPSCTPFLTWKWITVPSLSLDLNAKSSTYIV